MVFEMSGCAAKSSSAPGCSCVTDIRDKKCVDIDFNDANCADMAKCCVGVHNFGMHEKCAAAARKCRKLGSSWDPIAPMRPLNMEYIYTQTPGYATTGALVEKFGNLEDFLDARCILKNFACSLVIALVAKAVLSTEITIKQLLVLTFLISLIRCCVAKL